MPRPLNRTAPAPASPARPGRRRCLRAGGAAALVLALRPVAALADTPDLDTVVRQWAGGRPLRSGRITLTVPELVENGNAVPLQVSVDSPMRGDDRVVELAVFNERNPQREVLRCAFGPGCPRAEVHTRIRLATSQRLVALARLADGSQWQAAADVLVTLAACVEP